MKLTIPGEAVPQGRPRFSTHYGRVITYDPPKSKKYKDYVRVLFCSLCKGKFFTGALKLNVKEYRAIPKSWSKKKQSEALQGILTPLSRPDLDNIIKIVLDALNGIAWKDDSQIVSIEARKIYGIDPKVEIEIEELTEN